MTWVAQQLPGDHPPVKTGGVGVLLVNLGTPDAPTPAAVKRYLAEFLSDRRVVELPALLWQPILRGIILNTRPRKSAHAYSQVWTAEGSPLAAITARQAAGLQARLGDAVRVDWAMRYGNPSIPERLQALMEAGCERILLAPLYPQYCGATTATVVDKAAATLSTMRWQPTLRTLPPYHDDPAHIAALAADIGAQIDALDFVPEVLVLSFHGMPARTLALGDPYHCQCCKTARLLEAALGRPALRIRTSFQSRFGRAKWLEPATDAVIAEEAAEGTRRLAIAAPGFSADCLETLEELAIRGREQFIDAGGTHFATLACLNDGAPGMAMLEGLVRRELAGWIGGMLSEYLLVFALVFGINLLPAFGPPTAAIIVLLGVQTDVPLPGLVLTAAVAAASGRYLLAHGFRRFAGLVSAKTRANLAAARAAFEAKRHHSLAALAVFAISPLPSAQLFAAVGLTGVRILPFTLAFFAGRLVSYSLYAGSAELVAHSSIGDAFRASLTSPLGVVAQLAMLAALVALAKIDWAKRSGVRPEDGEP